MRLSNNQLSVLSLVSKALFGSKTYISIENFTLLKEESYDQAVLLLVYSVVSSILPSSDVESWTDLSDTISAMNMTVDFEHSELHELMIENNIPYTTIKGSGSAYYYPNPFKRMLGDVDFIVHKEDLDRAGSVLESAGFIRTEDKEHEAHIAYHRGDFSTWEMHFSINGIPDDKSGELLRHYLSDIIEKSVLYDVDGRVFRMPCTFHHGLILLIHTAEHLTCTGIGLRHLCDWAVFANRLSDEEFLDLFEEKLKKVGLWNFACILTILSERYLRMRHCAWVDSIEKPSEDYLERLMVDIFSGGNFGTKDKQRLNQAKLISDSSNRQIGKTNAVGQLIKSMNYKARIKMPIIKKAPILMPIGWIYTVCWYVGLLIKGKRPSINMKQMVEGAEERREIYKEFKLFEVEP